METKEQCKNREIINADCERCKEFNKNIRNSDLETKEQKIEKLKKVINIKKQLLKQYKHRDITYIIRQEFKMFRQQLKELEEE